MKETKWVFFLIFIVLLSFLSSNVDGLGAREIDFEGRTWTKAIRSQSSPWSDQYDLYKNDVTWSNSSGELSVEETTATSYVLVGFAWQFTATTNGIWFTLDAMQSASNAAALANGVVVSLFEVDATGTWINPNGLSLTTSTSFVNVGFNFSTNIGTNYALFFYYSDGWASDYDQRIAIKNFNIFFNDPASTVDNGEIDFVGRTWTKAIRSQSSPWSDQYDLYKNDVTWSNSSGELSVEETTATSNVLVGFAWQFTATTNGIGFKLDAMQSASNAVALANGVVVSLFKVDATGKWINPDGLSLTTSTSFVNVGYNFNTNIGTNYALFFYYSDGWASDYDQRIAIKNFKVFFNMDNGKIDFEGRTWTKAIRSQSSPWSDQYDLYKNDVTWSNSSGELSVEETTATSNVFVGFAWQFTATANGIGFTLDAMQSASNTAALANGVVVSLFEVDATGTWINPNGLSLTTSTSFVNVEYNFSTNIGTNYALFFYYSDGWASGYDQKIAIKNIVISFENPISPIITSKSISDPALSLPLKIPMVIIGFGIMVFTRSKKRSKLHI